ncbi:MAG: 50S ribosomal protein L23 [Nitrosospira sp.]|nr:50S ribosomal protein L23 [Nitrosospira sp.]MDW7643378.1 50S ribosomal protein L23 [Nitrosomonadaceae bacterium]MBI0408151.1 50S ribosomal protein L23 [Nitrosospira sp.]MBI0414635.1 50S ribosomal protein L23 [Nitrosospira sp.]MBI0415602.1 50S ribosomal protein L23 [Nitrosospira sp.]
MSLQVFSQERLMQVILAPQISEKATYLTEKHNQVIFRVVQDATKAEVKAAIELMWKTQNIEVQKVRVANVKGKEKRFGRFMGRSSNWKKAYVSIKSGQEINFSEIVQMENK